MYRVDVIMATYNGQKYIKEQIDSILQNKGVDVILHIFDDGSSDNTIKILNEYQDRYKKQVEIHQNEHNLGLTLNFLSGIRYVMEHNQEAMYFMCCDQDDVWYDDKIEKTLKRILQMEKCYGIDRPNLVFTDTTITDENLQLIEKSFYRSQRYHLNKLQLPHLLMENLIIGCTTMINRAFEPYLTKLPKHARYHDWWLALIASSFGAIHYLPRQTMYYRQHSGNVVGGARFGAYLANRARNLKNQKKSLLENKLQAEEFLSLFEKTLSPYHEQILLYYNKLFMGNYFKRRYIMFRYGFLKSGLARNLGLLLIL